MPLGHEEPNGLNGNKSVYACALGRNPWWPFRLKDVTLLINVEVVIYMEEICMKSEPCLIYHTSKVYFQVD